MALIFIKWTNVAILHTTVRVLPFVAELELQNFKLYTNAKRRNKSSK